MQLRIAIDGVHNAYHLSCLYLVPGLYCRALELAVEGEPVTVLDKYALVVPWHDDNLLYDPVEYGLDTGIPGDGY